MELKTIDMEEFEEDIVKEVVDVCNDIITINYPCDDGKNLDTEYSKVMSFISLDDCEYLFCSMSKTMEGYEKYIDKHLEGVKDPDLYLLKLGLDSYYRLDYDFEGNHIDQYNDCCFDGVVLKYFPEECVCEIYDLIKCTYIEYVFRCIEYLRNKTIKKLKTMLKQ